MLNLLPGARFIKKYDLVRIVNLCSDNRISQYLNMFLFPIKKYVLIIRMFTFHDVHIKRSVLYIIRVSNSKSGSPSTVARDL